MPFRPSAVLCCDVLVCCVAFSTSDGMATIGEELSDDDGGLRAGSPTAAYRPDSSTRQYHEPDEHDFDSMRGSM